jgi:hypothetical protein
MIGQKIRAVLRWIASPKVTRALAGPLLYGGVENGACNVPLQEARSILVVRLDGIGDLVLMSPFLRELRRLNPNAWITLVVDPAFVNLVEVCPLVSEVLTFQPCRRFGKLELHIRALRLARSHLWRRQGFTPGPTIYRSPAIARYRTMHKGLRVARSPLYPRRIC